ncbi:MAG: hypothetical protein ACE5KZ_13835 [Candidatus Scalinduaceae bacterium]
MKNNLFNTFHTYLITFQYLIKKLRENEKGRKEQHDYNIITSEIEKVRFLVKKAESKKEFEDLIGATKHEFSDYDERKNNKQPIRIAIHNFFRNSGCYLEIFNGKNLNYKKLFHSYWEEFQSQNYKTKLFAMMEYIDFSEKLIEFNSFQIRKFSIDEIITILRNEINEIFYPRCYYDTKELNILKNYWFIYLEAPQSELRLSRKIHATDVTSVIEKYTEYPKPLESVLKCLTIFDWKQNFNQQVTKLHDFTFNIPLILQIDESLLASPKMVPNLPFLETFLDEGPIKQELVEKPVVRFCFDAPETTQFKKFINDARNFIVNLKIEDNEWKFLEIAQCYLIKAFFSEGLDQFMWHITVIEALLCEDGRGTKKGVTTRIGAILGEAEEKIFDELYNLQYDLLHGNNISKKSYTNHAYIVRKLAVKIICWFLHYLDSIQTSIIQGKTKKQIPNHKELLILIDHVDHAHSCKSNFISLIDSMPKGFPHVPEWIEY